MIKIRERIVIGISLYKLIIIVGVLIGAFVLGSQASIPLLGSLVLLICAVLVLLSPALGILAFIPVALLGRVSIGTGSAVFLNPVTIMVPLLAVIALLGKVSRRDLTIARSKSNLPLLLFLVAGLLSFGIGLATWDPMVPRGNNFFLVQLAQWAIYAFSAGAFWLSANLIKDVSWLEKLTNTVLVLGGVIAILYALPLSRNLINGVATEAIIRSPFWVLLCGLVGGQLLFNDRLDTKWQVFLTSVLITIFMYAFIFQRESVSNWVGVGLVSAVLFWLRLPKFRWIILLVIIVLVLSGILMELVFQFAGGQEEWQMSGGSRLVLIERVISSAMRNPITGLGPAAYRAYGAMEPLVYQNAVWYKPEINSHNNFIDIFANFGIIGLALLGWFLVELGRISSRLMKQYPSGFQLAYVNGMIAIGVGSLGLMLLADWIIPFVYNIGFPGFQASILIWLFLGGLVAIENFES